MVTSDAFGQYTADEPSFTTSTTAGEHLSIPTPTNRPGVVRRWPWVKAVFFGAEEAAVRSVSTKRRR